MNQMLLFRGQKNQRTETLSNDPKSHTLEGRPDWLSGCSLNVSAVASRGSPRLGQNTRHNWTIFKGLNLRVAELGP